MKTQAQPAPVETPILPATLQRIVLTGFMGSGKTTVGRLLAERLGWSFLDLDTHIESRAGLTVPQIFARDGEARFRQLESSALAHALAVRATVLALGGGAPESLTNRLLLEQTPGTLTIFLDAPFPVLFDRCILQELSLSGNAGLNPTVPSQLRPVLADPALAEVRFAARLPLYRRLARIRLDTSELTPSATVEAIVHRLQEST